MRAELRIVGGGSGLMNPAAFASFRTDVTSASRALGWTSIVAAALAILALVFLPKLYVIAAIGLLLASIGVVLLIAATMHGRVNGALLTWLLLSPLAYYFLSIPTEKPLFTFDRFVIALLAGAAIFLPRSAAWPLSRELKWAALAWLVFIAFAFTSLIPVWSDLGLGGSRLITEAFIFPGIMALFVIRVFPARRYIRPVHTMIGITAIYCAAIGLVELITDRDLLPLPGATFYPTEQTGSLARVNGPFGANHCYGLIGMIILFLLLFLRRLLGQQLSRGRRILHWTAVTSALMMCLLPQFRALIVALAIVLFLELYHDRRVNTRIAAMAIIILSIVAVLTLPAVAPTFFDTRVADPTNFYARIAQQQQTWRLFLEHPINGVGFANFIQAIQTISSTTFHDVGSVDTAHNSLGSILAETGLVGAIPFVIANILWVLAFRQLHRMNTQVALLAQRYFLYIFLCYWMMGLTLTSAYERDVNLWYMFACALLYKLALTERTVAMPSPRVATFPS